MSSSIMISQKLISANANTVLRCASYSKKSKVFAFGAANLIHLYSPIHYKTYLTLNHHSDRVNTLKFFDNDELLELISCGADGKILHWVNVNKEKDPFDVNGWKMEKEYKSSDKGKNVSINLLDVLYINRFEKYIATFTSNGILDLFYFDVDLDEFKLFASMNYAKKLQDAICLTVLDDEYLLLLSGGYDSVINVHTVMRVNKINREVSQHSQDIKPLTFKVALTGHANDIRDIAAISPLTHQSEALFFCSCSQDSYIRTWNVSKLTANELSSMADKVNVNKTNSIFDEYKSKTSYVIDVDIDDAKGNKSKEYYNITLDSVLSGHEEAVSSVQWEKINDTYAILSSSFDFTVVVWTFDKKHNIWNKEHTLGEMLGNRHAFFYASFLDSYKEVIAYAYNGAIYHWKFDEEEKQYKNKLVTHGHFGGVCDIDWDPSNTILFSCGADETTRAFGYWTKNDSWHEINRPQIHGYAINTIACAKQNGDKEMICKLISGADEKLLRVFTPPFNIIKFMKELSGKELQFKKDNTNDFYEKTYSNVEGSKQALGLMNRQVVLDSNANDDNVTDYGNFDPDAVLTNKTEQFYISKYDYALPPNEDFLSNNTLWPEECKLYGHGCEIFSLAISHDGKFIASGQKAQQEKNASLFLWNAATNKLIDKIPGHTLTIAQIEFSPNDEFILTGSRDRAWCVFKRSEDKSTYEKYQYVKNAHGRIIWSVSWCDDNKRFITGSRDKNIAIWEYDESSKQFKQICKKDFGDAVTSVCVIRGLKTFKFIVGLESGVMKICKFEKDVEVIGEWPIYIQHGKAVKRIKTVVDEKKGVVRVGSCGEDYTVRISEINIKDIDK